MKEPTPKERCEKGAEALAAILERYNLTYEVDIEGDFPIISVIPAEDCEDFEFESFSIN